MGLYVVEPADIVWIGVCPLDGQHLPFLSRRPQALAFAVAGDANATDDGPNAVAVGNRSGESLDHQGHVAFGRHEPIGIFAKWTGTHVAHRLGRRKEHQAVRFAVRSPTYNRLINATLQECPGPNGHRLQRRRAGRINDKVWPIQSQSLLHNLGNGQRAKIARFASRAPGIPAADGSSHLGSHAFDIASKQRSSSLHLAQEMRCLIDAGGVDNVTDLRASTGMADIDSSSTISGHGKWIHTGIPARQRRHLQKNMVRDVVLLDDFRCNRADFLIHWAF